MEEKNKAEEVVGADLREKALSVKECKVEQHGGDNRPHIKVGQR